MPCTPIAIDGQFAGYVCTRGGGGRKGRCVVCQRPSVAQCDGPRPAGRKRGDCDKHLCAVHRTSVGPDVDLCPACLPLLPLLVVKEHLMSENKPQVADVLLEVRLLELGRELERAEAAAQAGEAFTKERAAGRAEGLRKALELLGMPELVGARAPVPPAASAPPAAPDPADMARCSSCKAAIRWVTTHTGSPMPVDYEAKPDGNLVLAKSADGKFKSEPFKAELHAQRRRFVSHFGSCPNAKTHRKGGGS